MSIRVRARDASLDSPASRDAPRRWLFWPREPLLQFLLIGGALFLLHRTLNGDAMTAPRAIIVSEAQIAALEENFARTWGHRPPPDVLRGLVSDYVTEEVYYRSALAMGLDRDDMVVRRRLRQKMEFIDDVGFADARPSAADLRAYLNAHQDRFAGPARVTFRQVFLSRTRHGDAVAEDATRLIATLQTKTVAAPSDRFGDRGGYPASMDLATSEEVATTFGPTVAQVLATAPLGRWVGPTPSNLGVHLLCVDRREPGGVPPLSAIRAEVEHAWQAEQRDAIRRANFTRLRANFDIRVEGPLGTVVEMPSLAATRPGM